MDKSEITGALGTPAPPGAPHEVTAPGSERPTPEQIAEAHAHEVELPPFNPGGGTQMTIPMQAVFLGKTVEEIIELRVAAGIPTVDEGAPDARLPASAVVSEATAEDLANAVATAVPAATSEAAAGPPARDASVASGTAMGPTVADQVMTVRREAGLPVSDLPTTPPNPAPSPPANLPAGVILDARGKPMTSSVRPVPPRPRPQRPSLRTVHKPPTVVAGEPVEQQEPPQGLPEDVDTLDLAPTYGGQPRDQSSALDDFADDVVGGTADALPAPEPEPSPLPIARPDPAKHQPAASDTDSPARGTPPPMETLPEGKRITGGFGDPAEAEYYPLDGTELRALIYALMDSIHARLQDDLRFSFAITYPRVSARVVVEIEAFAQDQTLTVEKMMTPHTKTPMEVARRYGDQVVFCVTAERAEMTEDGQSIAPPNQTRQELQLPIPRKTAVQTPAGRMIVDVRR